MLRKTIYAIVAILAVGSTIFAPLSASADGRQRSGIHSNYHSPCDPRIGIKGPPGPHALAFERPATDTVFRR
jgi:hypothetical protein